MKLAGIFFLFLVMLPSWAVGAPVVKGSGEAVRTAAVAEGDREQPAMHLASSSQDKKIFRSIGPEEAMRLLQSRDDIVFLDVRTLQERSQGAIPGSKLVSIFDLVQGKLSLPKDKPVLLVCAVGGRSYAAGQVLSRQGYREVYNLSGGINAWYKAGLPISVESSATR